MENRYYLNPTIPLMQKVRFFFRHELRSAWREVKFYWADPLYRVFGLVRHKLYQEQWERRVEADQACKHWYEENRDNKKKLEWARNEMNSIHRMLDKHDVPRMQEKTSPSQDRAFSYSLEGRVSKLLHKPTHITKEG
jgi:hypothetical protein